MTTVPDTFYAPSDLALDLARSQIGIAAMRRRSAHEQPSSAERDQAKTLRDYFILQLESRRGPRQISDDEVPRPEIRKLLQDTFARYVDDFLPNNDVESMEQIIPLLERFMSGTLTAKDAADLLRRLNSVTPTPTIPTYDLSSFSTRRK
jgi:hypothetical protein